MYGEPLDLNNIYPHPKGWRPQQPNAVPGRAPPEASPRRSRSLGGAVRTRAGSEGRYDLPDPPEVVPLRRAPPHHSPRERSGSTGGLFSGFFAATPAKQTAVPAPVANVSRRSPLVEGLSPPPPRLVAASAPAAPSSDAPRRDKALLQKQQAQLQQALEDNARLLDKLERYKKEKRMAEGENKRLRIEIQAATEYSIQQEKQFLALQAQLRGEPRRTSPMEPGTRPEAGLPSESPTNHTAAHADLLSESSNSECSSALDNTTPPPLRRRLTESHPANDASVTIIQELKGQLAVLGAGLQKALALIPGARTPAADSPDELLRAVVHGLQSLRKERDRERERISPPPLPAPPGDVELIHALQQKLSAAEEVLASQKAANAQLQAELTQLSNDRAKSITLSVAAKDDLKEQLMRVKDELSCPVCLELFYSDPITLHTCGHSFCRRCLMSITTIGCPSCRTNMPTMPKSVLKSSRTLQSAAEGLLEIEKSFCTMFNERLPDQRRTRLPPDYVPDKTPQAF